VERRDGQVAPALAGRVAVVTGASRGVGKGVALGLGEAGATVYVTGRSLEGSEDRRGSLSRTVEEIDSLGGHGVAVQCDHAIDGQVEAVLDRVRAEHGRLDVLVNNVMSTPQRAELPAGARSQWDLHPFWEVPIAFWDTFHIVGLRSHYVASAFAAPLLIESGGGLIVCISAPGSSRYVGNIAYGVGKAGVEKLVADMAEELRPHNVTSVSLWPGFIRTRRVSRPQQHPFTTVPRPRSRCPRERSQLARQDGHDFESDRARTRIRLHRHRLDRARYALSDRPSTVSTDS